MAADGKSLITAVGTQDDSVWVHDEAGDHQISSEGSAEHPSFSADGSSLYFLMVNGQNHKNELWRRDLSSGQQEKVLPGYSIGAYSVSHDGKLVAFSVKDASSSRNTVGGSHRSQLFSGEVIFRHERRLAIFSAERRHCLSRVWKEGRTSFIASSRTAADARKFVDGSVFDLLSVSPDGRWVIATSAAG